MNIQTKKMDKRKSGSRCVLPHCGKTMRNTVGIKMFKFPPEGSLLGNVWRQVCGLPMDKGKIYICDTHFSKDLIGLKHRKRDAIPSLLLTANNNENQKLSVAPSPLVKLENLDKHELNSSETVESFCSNCEKNKKYMHFYMGKCSFLQKQKSVLQARIKSYCKFQKRAQIQIFMLRNLCFKTAQKYLRSSQDEIFMDTLNSKFTKQEQEMIKRENEMEWKLLTQITEDTQNQENYIEEKQDFTLRSKEGKEKRFLFQSEDQPIQIIKDTEGQYHNQPLSSGTPDKFDACKVKRNEIISRYRLRRSFFSTLNKKKRNKINYKTKRRSQLPRHILSRERRIQNYSGQHMEYCETMPKTKFGSGRLETQNQTIPNLQLVADKVKIEMDVLQDTTINTLPAKQNNSTFSNMQENDHEFSGSSKDSFITVGKTKSQRCFPVLNKSKAAGRFSNSSSQPTKIYQSKVEESLDNMKLLIKASSKYDRFTVFGKNIAQKIIRSERDNSEVKIAKSLIDNILQNLAIGVYSSHNE